MMLGHAALAFAIAAWAAVSLGVSRERALVFGLAAGGFAVVPDVDMGYAVVGLVDILTNGAAFPEAFWSAGNVVHRGLTHSLVVGGIAATLFGLVTSRGPTRLVAVGGLGAGVVLSLFRFSPLEAGVLTLFALAGVTVAFVARRGGLEPPAVLAAALVGLLSHPFGDLFTGTTPKLFAPVDVRLLPDLVELSSDPTVHLLTAFGVELVSIWLAVVVALWLHGLTLREHVHRRAALGVGYVGMVFVVSPPTLAVSYEFVGSVLAVSLVGVVNDLPVPTVRPLKSRLTIAVTGLTAVTVAWLAYTGGYLVVS
jgi:membrane-bound metal-dependent hydrolase YbcI (DUF457 family)